MVKKARAGTKLLEYTNIIRKLPQATKQPRDVFHCDYTIPVSIHATGRLHTEDFPKICRLCSSSVGPMLPLWKENSLNSSSSSVLPELGIKISFCTSIEMSSSDHLPRQICATCEQMIDMFFAFKTFCQHINVQLNNVMAEEQQGPSPSAHSSREHFKPKTNPSGRLDSSQSQTNLNQALLDAVTAIQRLDLPLQVPKASLATFKPHGPKVVNDVFTSNFHSKQNNKRDAHLTICNPPLTAYVPKAVHSQIIIDSDQVPTCQRLGQEIYRKSISGQSQNESSSENSPYPLLFFQDSEETEYNETAKASQVDPLELVTVSLRDVPNPLPDNHANVLKRNGILPYTSRSSVDLQPFLSKRIEIPQQTQECDMSVPSHKQQPPLSEPDSVQRHRAIETLQSENLVAGPQFRRNYHYNANSENSKTMCLQSTTSSQMLLPRNSDPHGPLMDQPTSQKTHQGLSLASTCPHISSFTTQQVQTSSILCSPCPNIRPLFSGVLAGPCTHLETYRKRKSANGGNPQQSQITSKFQEVLPIIEQNPILNRLLLSDPMNQENNSPPDLGYVNSNNNYRPRHSHLDRSTNEHAVGLSQTSSTSLGLYSRIEPASNTHCSKPDNRTPESGSSNERNTSRMRPHLNTNAHKQTQTAAAPHMMSQPSIYSTANTLTDQPTNAQFRPEHCLGNVNLHGIQSHTRTRHAQTTSIPQMTHSRTDPIVDRLLRYKRLGPQFYTNVYSENVNVHPLQPYSGTQPISIPLERQHTNQTIYPEFPSPDMSRNTPCGHLSSKHVQAASISRAVSPNGHSLNDRIVTDQHINQGTFPRDLANINISKRYVSLPQYNGQQSQSTPHHHFPLLQVTHQRVHPVSNSVLPAQSTCMDIFTQERDSQNTRNTGSGTSKRLDIGSTPQNPHPNIHSVSNRFEYRPSLEIFSDTYSHQGVAGSRCPPPLYFQDSAQAEYDEIDQAPQDDPLKIESPSELSSCKFRTQSVPMPMAFKMDLDNFDVIQSQSLPANVQLISIKIEPEVLTDKLPGGNSPSPLDVTPSVSSVTKQHSDNHENSPSGLHSVLSTVEEDKVSKIKQNKTLSVPNGGSTVGSLCQSQSQNKTETNKVLSKGELLCANRNDKSTEDKTMESRAISKEPILLVTNQTNKVTEVAQTEINEECPFQNDSFVQEDPSVLPVPQSSKQVDHHELCSSSKEEGSLGIKNKVNRLQNKTIESIPPCKQSINVEETPDQKCHTTCGNDSKYGLRTEGRVINAGSSCAVTLEDDSPLSSINVITKSTDNVNLKFNEKSDCVRDITSESRGEKPETLRTGESSTSVIERGISSNVTESVTSSNVNERCSSSLTANESMKTVCLGSSTESGSSIISNYIPKEITQKKDDLSTSMCINTDDDTTVSTHPSTKSKDAQNSSSIQKLKKETCDGNRTMKSTLKRTLCGKTRYVIQISKRDVERTNSTSKNNCVSKSSRNASQFSERKNEDHTSTISDAIEILKSSSDGIQSCIRENEQSSNASKISEAKKEQHRTTYSALQNSERIKQDSTLVHDSDSIQTYGKNCIEEVCLAAKHSVETLTSNVNKSTSIKHRLLERKIGYSNQKHSSNDIQASEKKCDIEGGSLITLHTGMSVVANGRKSAIETYEQKKTVEVDAKAVSFATKPSDVSLDGNVIKSSNNKESQISEGNKPFGNQKHCSNIIKARRKKLAEALSLVTVHSPLGADGVDNKPANAKAGQSPEITVLDINKKHCDDTIQTYRTKVSSEAIPSVILSDASNGSKPTSSKAIHTPEINIIDNNQTNCNSTIETCGKQHCFTAVFNKPAMKTYGQKRKSAIKWDPLATVFSNSSANTCQGKPNSKTDSPVIIIPTNKNKPEPIADVFDGEISASNEHSMNIDCKKLSIELDDVNCSACVAKRRKENTLEDICKRDVEVLTTEKHGKLHTCKKPTRKQNKKTKNKEVHQCEYCSEIVSTKAALKRHLSDHSIGIVRTRPCCFCNFMCESMRLLELHIRSEHDNALLLACALCKMPHKTVNSLITHMNKLHDMVETHDEVSNDAVKSKHSQESGEYEITFKSIKKVPNLTIFEVTNLIFRCVVCKEMFLTKRELDMHLATLIKSKHHNISHFKCVKMNKRCKLRHICSFCNNVFITSLSLSNHVLLNHLGPYVCVFCTKHYKSMDSLEYHGITNHKNEKLKCKICERVFTTFETYYKHEEVHTDQCKTSAISCAICSKTVKSKDRIVKHMRTHTGETPYTCPYCPRKFTLPWNREMHIRLHTGDKRYVCVKCGKAFTHNVSRKNHMKYHNEETEKMAARKIGNGRKNNKSGQDVKQKKANKSKKSSTAKKNSKKEEVRVRRRTRKT